MKETFEKIIKTHYWLDHVCGSGSTMEYTYPLRQELCEFLEKHNIQSMFDAPCGDYSWMSKTKLPNNFKYIGGDIVEDLIANNRKMYPSTEFHCVDISADPIPDVDLLFCRDCLIHFSVEDKIKTFKNIVNSNVKYIMFTNYFSDCANNVDITTGSFHAVDFTQPPYDFEDPIDSIFDWVSNTTAGGAKRNMSLWHISTIEKFLTK